MKIFRWLPLLLALLLLPTGCASINESANLTPRVIRSTFDNVRVQIAGGNLHVYVVSFGYDLKNLQVEHATTSTWTTEKRLSLQQMFYSPDNPHEAELVFTPAPAPPFSINLTTEVNGKTLFLRADYYGPHAITF